MKIDGDLTKPRAPNKEQNIPPIPANAASEVGCVDEYAMLVYASGKLIYPGTVLLYMIVPLHDETYMFLTHEIAHSLPRRVLTPIVLCGLLCSR
jgi:hypothetical protein